MKIRLCICFTSVFIVLMLLVSTESAFAQKKLKYMPEIVESTVKSTVKGAGKSAAKKSTRIPAAINPKLPVHVQRRLAESSGIVVNTTTAKRTSPGGKTDLSGATKVLAPAQITTEVEIDAAGAFSGAEAEMDIGTNLTGVQVLQAYFPTWRQELGGMFSPEQLNTVEYAMKATDDWIFVRGANGELQIRNKDEWNYEARFLTILRDSGVSFTERQLKQLVGGKGIKGFTFKIYFFRMNAVGFTSATENKPRQQIFHDGRSLTREEMTPQETQEAIIGRGLDKFRNHPAVLAYMQENRCVSIKTPEEYVALARQYPTKPRAHISRNGRILTREEMTPEEIQEVSIGIGLDNNRNHPAVIAYMKENRLRAEDKTPEEYVALAQQYPAKPRAHISRNGRILTREEMTPEEIQEVNIGIGLSTYRNHPAVVAYMQKNRRAAEAKTPEEYVALAQQYPAKPRASISRNGRILTREEMTPEEIQEVIIGKGLSTHRNHPAVVAYMQKNRRAAEAKTPEEYVALARQYPTKPRTDIYRHGRTLTREAMTPEEIQEVIIGRGLDRNRKHPAVIAYMQENRLKAENQTAEQLYTALVAHIKDYGRYPLQNENYLQHNIYARLRYYQSTMVDGKYQDPWLQKIYELKTAVENAPEGKFTLTPDGQGGYILEIEEPAAEEMDVTAPHKVEEVAPAVPSPHTIRLRINEETKNLVLATRDHAALERREFPGWLRSMHTAENRPQIANQHTFDALHVLNRAINFDYRRGKNRRPVTHLLETVNNYVGLLGDQEVAFYKLIYRGTVDPEILPVADHFHVVAETQGLSWDGELAPQIEKVNRAYAQAVKRGETPSVYLEGDDEMVTALGIEGRINIRAVKADLENVIADLLPPGYTVRMGVHELGISGSNLDKFQKGRVHIHLENTSPALSDEGLQIDHSISLDVKVGRFAGWWDANARQFYPFSDAQIAQNYRTLFDSFLDQEAKDKLDELAR